MSSLSLFQLLPSHIVKLIVYYVSPNRYPDARWKAHKPLLWVCNNFRAEVYSLNSRTYRLDISNSACKPGPITKVKRCPWIFCQHYSGHSAHLLARNLEINVELECIYSHRALRMLSRAPYKDCVFPLVRSLSFTLDMNNRRRGRDIYASVAQDNIAAFVQRLRLMAPRAHESSMYTPNRNKWPENSVGHFTSLVKQILQLTNRFDNRLGELGWTEYLDFAGVCNLAHISYSFDDNRAICFQLARQCAPTLQSLKLQSLTGVREEHLNLSGLIQDDGGSCVTYACLQSLTLDLWNNSATPQRPSFGVFVAYPVLRHLTIKHEYPFSDDTLFRGNAATLESLRMRMDVYTIKMLRERRVFTQTSHPQLQLVATDGTVDFAQNGFASSADYMQFVLSVGFRAAVRVIPTISFDQDIPRTLQVLGKHTAIRALTITWGRATLLNIVALIKAIPLLSELNTTMPQLDSHLVDLPKLQLVETLIEGHAPMGKQFRRWILQGSVWEMECVDHAILLALLCPNLYIVDITRVSDELADRHAKDYIALHQLEQYEQRLRQLTIGRIQFETVTYKRCPIFGELD
ncbi:hypothetical protein GGF42_005519 [Coemansia sp. RSA 2424]|nr:hypothetical protein GGF42_005519 [Coemansia sp. RSA 2424]